jgi:hypothetical protein
MNKVYVRERMIIEYVAMVIKILVFVGDFADINYVAMH